MDKKGIMFIISMLFLPLLILLSQSVHAASSQNTTTNVFIMNSAPVVHQVNVQPDPAEPGDTLNITANVTDVNGVPYDISNVTAVVDMGTPSDQSDDVSVPLSYNSTSKLYENKTYSLPINAPFGVYTVNVTAIDKHGQSDSNTTTFNVTDLTNPTIQWVNATPNPVDPGNTINITAKVTDNVGVDTVVVEINGQNYTMNYSGNDIYYYDGFDTFIEAGTYNYTVYANDTYGNDATPVTSNFTINELISLSLSQTPIEFGNTTIPVTNRRADNGTSGNGYTGGTVKGFPMVVNNTGNVNENFTISGTGLIGQTNSSFTIGAGNVSYNTINDINSATSLSTTAQQLASNIAMNNISNAYFWLSIPEGVPSQQYIGTINVTAIKS